MKNMAIVNIPKAISQEHPVDIRVLRITMTVVQVAVVGPDLKTMQKVMSASLTTLSASLTMRSSARAQST